MEAALKASSHERLPTCISNDTDLEENTSAPRTSVKRQMGEQGTGLRFCPSPAAPFWKRHVLMLPKRPCARLQMGMTTFPYSLALRINLDDGYEGLSSVRDGRQELRSP